MGDAFGNEKDRVGSDPNPFRYCGEYFDVESGCYYLRARYYDPSVGRFTQEDAHWNTSNMIYGDEPQQIGEYEDPLGTSRYTYAPQITAVMQAGNLYRYTSGNPVKWSDPDGEIGVLVTLAIGAAIGALVGGTVQAIKNIKNGEKWTEGIGKALLAGAVSGAISVIPIPGVNAWVAVAITGAAGNVAGQLIAGEIKTVGDVTSALLAGAAAGIIGKGAAELLSHGVEAYFKTLTKAQQKAFLNGLSTFNNYPAKP